MDKLLKFSVVLAATAIPYYASAITISYNANSDGVNAPAGSSFTASGDLGVKSQAGFDVLGVEGGGSGNEIDLGEWLQINLDQPLRFTKLTLGLLFDGTEYGDRYEIAVATTTGNIVYTLQATGTTTATWSGPGTVINLSQATEQGAAVWQINNPFGTDQISTVRLEPGISNPAQFGGNNESDFGLQAFTAVPDGGSTLALTGLGLGLLGLIRRKIA